MSLTTSEFLSCTPYPATVTDTVTSTFTTTYCYTGPAACPTSAWMATYTIVEICTGNRATWTPPAIPPNFVQTTVVCDVCATPTQTIYCPTSTPVPTGVATGVLTVGGNGVTASTGVVVAPPTGKPVVVTAGAPSLKKGLAVIGSLALIAGQMLL
ncbi:uncharacterized protein E0L32_010922 [Thyridium curvatum]|uniref:Uncharacterized protein n=1 Tax=Thyridium curvatum TaxID=1093900 RepID=A0A507AQJ6_9PEZI|nr:uncharacterized protein E0L32_010922 [Thyridium curvatum]TPX07121.1 hypothetical protein E0L32_010922 [Thyridium curvatum]